MLRDKRSQDWKISWLTWRMKREKQIACCFGFLLLLTGKSSFNSTGIRVYYTRTSAWKVSCSTFSLSTTVIQRKMSNMCSNDVLQSDVHLLFCGFGCSVQDRIFTEMSLVQNSFLVPLSLSLSSGIAVGLANPVSLDELPLLSRLSKRLSFSSFLRHYEDLVLLCRLRLSCHQSVTLKWFLVKESKQPHPFYHCLSFDNPLSRKMRKKLYSLKSFCFTPSSKQLELSKPSLLRVTHARHHQIDYYLLTSKSTNFSRSKKLNSLTNGFAEIIQSRESFLVKSFLSCFEGLSSSSSNNEQHFSFRSKQWNNVMR